MGSGSEVDLFVHTNLGTAAGWYGFISIGQGQWKGKYFSLSCSEEATKKLRIVLQGISDVIFYPCYYNSFGC